MSLDPSNTSDTPTAPDVDHGVDQAVATLTNWITPTTPPAGPKLIPPPPPAPVMLRSVGAGGGVSAYGASALAGEVAELTSMGDGSGRNDALNIAAYKLAGWIATGDLTETAITEGLYDAAVRNGYVTKRGERAARNTIRSGLSAGATAPRAKATLHTPIPAVPPVTLLPPPPPAAAGPGDDGMPWVQVLSVVEPEATPATDDEPPAAAPLPGDEKPAIDVSGGGAAAIRALHDAIDHGIVPDLYVTNGDIVRLEQVSGDVATARSSCAAPVAARTLGPDGFASLLARRTYCYVSKLDKETGKRRVAETVPAARLLASTLADQHWPGVRPLHGIVATPILRPDGSLLQEPGYDPATGLFYAAKVAMPTIPKAPSPEEVATSRVFLLDELLSGFPWVEQADLANFVGLLISHILRPYLGTLTPFGMITATTASSGKSLLTELLGALYSSRIVTWPRGDDAELRKAITAVLIEPAAVIVWDNLREGSVLDAPVLAQLITAQVWSDRQLGASKNISTPNDRLWLATGNNLRLGGDMATRTVLVRLDPKMPHPEERTGFAIPNLDQWIRGQDAQRTVLYHLLVLVADWIAAGAPRSGQVMRQFTGWAQAVGGLLDHHQIPGFLANVDAIRAMDDDDNEWAVFFAKWHELYGDKPLTAAELRRSADVDFTPFTGPVDKWDGAFLVDGRTGLPVNAKSLGRRLAGQVGRFHGDYVLHRGVISHGPVTIWSVQRTDTTTQ